METLDSIPALAYVAAGSLVLVGLSLRMARSAIRRADEALLFAAHLNDRLHQLGDDHAEHSGRLLRLEEGGWDEATVTRFGIDCRGVG